MTRGERVGEEAGLIVELVAEVQVIRVFDGANAAVRHEKGHFIFNLNRIIKYEEKCYFRADIEEMKK